MSFTLLNSLPADKSGIPKKIEVAQTIESGSFNLVLLPISIAFSLISSLEPSTLQLERSLLTKRISLVVNEGQLRNSISVIKDAIRFLPRVSSAILLLPMVR